VPCSSRPAMAAIGRTSIRVATAQRVHGSPIIFPLRLRLELTPLAAVYRHACRPCMCMPRAAAVSSSWSPAAETYQRGDLSTQMIMNTSRNVLTRHIRALDDSATVDPVKEVSSRLLQQISSVFCAACELLSCNVLQQYRQLPR